MTNSTATAARSASCCDGASSSAPSGFGAGSTAAALTPTGAESQASLMFAESRPQSVCGTTQRPNGGPGTVEPQTIGGEAVEARFVRFVVPGEPQGKGRARLGKVGGHARMFTPAKTVAYEGLIAVSAQQAMAGRVPHQGPCWVQIDAHVSVPASWSKKKRAAALAGGVYPTSKPDVDNIAKAVGDGANGVVWADDRQIVDLRIRRRYAETPSLCVDVMLCEV